jgi:hypothetical protein
LKGGGTEKGRGMKRPKSKGKEKHRKEEWKPIIQIRKSS